ncbi:MAG: hypothetical protein N2746_02205 [Deltaproteobacteria bacterium]|nr:hypothetical protein [Deltaproteobacteria bacterium]
MLKFTYNPKMEAKEYIYKNLYFSPLVIIIFVTITHCSEEVSDLPNNKDGSTYDVSEYKDGSSDISADTDIPEVPGVKAYFKIPEDKTPQNFYFFPFPSDLLINSDGTLNIDGFPNPANIDLLTIYLETIKNNFSGFSTQGAIYIKFDDKIDTTSLPQDPLKTIVKDSPLFLINVTDNKYKGERIPLLLRFVERGDKYISSNTLIITPENGFVLRPKNRYALVITRRIKGSDGRPLGSSKEFESTKSSMEFADARLERARRLYYPIYKYLKDININKEDIAVMTIFTTLDPVGELKKMRDFVVEKGELNFKEIKKDTTTSSYCGINGIFRTYQFQKGAPPYDSLDSGMFEFDNEGNPIVQRREDVRFYLTIPNSEMPQNGFPVVLYAHGTGGNYKSFIYEDIAENLALKGIAVVSFDQPLHGGRNTGNWNVEMKTFNINNMLATRDNFRQSAIDTIVLMHILMRNTIQPGVSCNGREIRFDKNKFYFFGHSQGGLTGPLFVGVEPDIKAALFSAGGGRFIISVYQKTEPIDIPKIARILLALDEKDHDIDLFHPVLNLLQIMADPADPANYGRLLIKNPVCKDGICLPKHIFMTEGTSDPFTPPDAIEVLAMSIGVNPYKEIYRSKEFFERYGVHLVSKDDLPNNAKTEDGSGSSTGVLVQFKDQGHFPIFYDTTAIEMYKTFFYNIAYKERAVLEE